MKTALRRAFPDTDAEKLDKLERYAAMLIEQNRSMNLTAITDTEGIVQKHFADSLAALPYLPKGARCIDVGTGAGFPGVPLQILREDIRVTLLDATKKKLAFLEAVCRELELPAVTLHMRAEDAGRDARYRERFDCAFSRAVAALPALLELTAPFVRVGGKLIAYKGDAAGELTAAEHAAALLGVRLSSADVTGGYGKRTLVFGEKQRHTPAAYPRKAGMPAKSPL